MRHRYHLVSFGVNSDPISVAAWGFATIRATLSRTLLAGSMVVACSFTACVAQAVDCCQNSVAIIASLTGQASVRTAATSRAAPASSLGWLAAGVTVESGAKSGLVIILTNGRRYELGEHARATVSADALTTVSGPVHELPRLPPLPKPAAIAGNHSTIAGAVRIRGAVPQHLYPDGGAAAVPGAVKLTFSPVGAATSYTVTLLDENEDALWKQQTNATSIDVPGNLVKPGARYLWRVRALGAGAVLGEGAAQFETISQENLTERRDLATALSGMDEPSKLALVAAVDLRLGLMAEAIDELSEALHKKPGDAEIERALADARAALAASEK